MFLSLLCWTILLIFLSILACCDWKKALKSLFIKEKWTIPELHHGFFSQPERFPFPFWLINGFIYRRLRVILYDLFIQICSFKFFFQNLRMWFWRAIYMRPDSECIQSTIFSFYWDFVFRNISSNLFKKKLRKGFHYLEKKVITLSEEIFFISFLEDFYNSCSQGRRIFFRFGSDSPVQFFQIYPFNIIGFFGIWSN